MRLPSRVRRTVTAIKAQPVRLQAAGFIVVFAVIGGTFVILSHAATNVASFQAEGGTLANGAQVVTDSTASNGSAVKFAATVTGDWWHTSGGTILNSKNQEVFLRGIDGRIYPNANNVLQTPDATEMSNISGWGFSFIRLGVLWSSLEPTMPTGAGVHSYSSAYLTDLDNTMALAKKDNIKVVIDMHQANWSPLFGGNGFPNWLYPNEAACTHGTGTCNTEINGTHCDFFSNTAESGVTEKPQDGLIAVEKMLAQRYASDPTMVGTDMFNEPQGCSVNGGASTYSVPGHATPLDDFYQNAAAAITAVNPNQLLIYEDDSYESYLNHGFAVSRKLNLPNTIYSTHVYPDSWTNGNASASCKPSPSDSGQKVLADHLARSSGWNQPMYIGEFDGFHLDNQGCPYYTTAAAASADTLTMMAWFKQNHVDWSLWEYDGPQGLVGSGGSASQPLLQDLQAGL